MTMVPSITNFEMPGTASMRIPSKDEDVSDAVGGRMYSWTIVLRPVNFDFLKYWFLKDFWIHIQLRSSM